MGVQLHIEKVKESSKENYHNLKSILEELDANQLLIEMKAYDAINSSDMLLNFVKEVYHSLNSLQYDEITGIIRPKEELEYKEITKEEMLNRICCLKELIKSMLEAAYISNQVSRDIEHEVANQREIIDVINSKIKHNRVVNS